MKMLKRTLALMLALIMMFSAVPFNAYATESTDEPSVPTEAPVDVPETEEPAAEEPVVEDEVVEEPVVEEPAEEEEVVEAPQSRAVPASNTVAYKYNVVHLDAGRKYFSVDNIKAIIDNIDAAGFNQLNLYLSDNQGFRFALDDMTLTTDYGTYNLTPALGDGYSSKDNKAPDGTGMYLTQSEMDTIITYAHSKGIDIVPAINVPGHMGAILEEFPSFCYKKGSSTSKSSIDLANDKAVAFALALTEKYATYFASKGCKYYCVGADEYANDLSSMGFEGMGRSLYTKFVQFLNDAADIVIDLGMTPRAFNDGFYYKDYKINIEPNKAYEVYYWSSGWGGYDVAAASTISAKGHEMINTHGDYYWVLGNSSWQCSATKASQFDETAFQGSTVSDPAGSMFCIWCDNGAADTCENVIFKTASVISAFGSVLPEVEDLVSGIVTPDPEEPDVPVEPEEPETVTKTDEATKVEITAPGLTGLTVAEATAPAVEGAAEGKVLAWDMAPTTADGNYTGEATVAVPVPDGWDGNKMGAFVITDGAVKLLSGELNEAGLFQFTMPHFSVGGVYEIAPAAATPVEIQLKVGGTHKVVVEGKNLSGTYTPDPAGVANVTVSYEKVDGETVVTLGSQITPANTSGWSDTGVIKSGNNYLVMDSTGNLSVTTDIADATVFTVTRPSSGNYQIKNSSNYYLYYNNSSVSGNKNAYNWKYDDGFYRRSTFGYTSYYLTYSNGWTTASNASNETYLYDVSSTTTDPVDESTITFTGVSVGETTATIGSTTYRIVVSKKAESATVTIDATLTYDDTSANITVADDSVVSAEQKDGKLVITGLKEGNTTVTTDNAVYTVTVIPFDPDNAGTVPVFFWVTSHPITAQVNGADATSMEIRADDANVYSENGAKLSALVPTYGIDKQNTTAGTHALWHVRLQHEGAQQTTGGSDDKTAVGEHVDFIRYYGNKWQVKDLNGNWLDVAEDDQLTAYYLMKSALTDEVDSLVKDWGFQFKDGQKTWQYFDENSYCALSAQVIYEDATMNPANDAALIDTTYFFNYWAKGQDKHTANRDIGFFLPQVNDDFEIYKITTMHGTCSVTASGDKASAASVDYDNPNPNHADEVVVWKEGDGLAEIVGKDGDPALQWSAKKDAILIRIYVRAKVTDDTLKVVYIDEKFNDELYSYNINVHARVNFNNGIDPKPGVFEDNTARIDVTNTGIVNFKGVKQMFQTDLSKVPEAVGKYDSELYDYTGSLISEDGKTLYLYYNIDTTVLKPNFVVDFGLPITFSLSEVTNNPTTVKSVTCSARYGTLTYKDGTFTYTPTLVLPNVDVLSIGLLFEGENYISTTNVGVTPATTVYYEESFLSYSGDWTKPAAPSSHQTTEVLGEHTHNYGYDPIYADDLTGSNGTKASTSTNGASASFTFTGTGFELYANCNEGTGYVTVTSDGQTKKMYMVDTGLNYNDPEIDGDMPGTTTNPTGTFYNIPVISEKNLPHGTYTVTIRKTHKDDQAFEIDGVRITNTIDESAKANADSIYVKDLEDKPEFYQLRDFVLNSIGIDGADAQQVYNDISGAKAIVTTADVPYTDTTAQDLLNNGPKNELYLFSGQTLTFNVKTARKMQIGLKAPNGATTYDLKCTDVADKTNVPMNTSVDMFYELGNTRGTEKTYTVSVKNTGKNVLAVTDLKICDDPNFGFVALTEDDIAKVLGVEETPVEPEVPETTEPEVPETTEPEVPETTEPAKPTKPTEPTKPSKPTKPTEPTKPSKPTKPTEPTKPTKPTEPQKPTKPGNNGNNKPGKEEKTYTLKVTFVNLFGKKVGTATITTTNGVVSAYEIVGKAPAGRMAIWLIPVTLRANGNTSIVVPVL